MVLLLTTNSLLIDLHVSNICKSAHSHNRCLKFIWTCLTEEVAWTVGAAVIHSQFDYTNALLFGLSKWNIEKLRRDQHSLAWFIIGQPCCSSNLVPTLKLSYNWHWLPSSNRTVHSVKVSCFHLRHPSFSSASTYLDSLILIHQSAPSLRSYDQLNSTQPSPATAHSHIGCRAFQGAALVICNHIPLHIRQAISLYTFQRVLILTTSLV